MFDALPLMTSKSKSSEKIQVSLLPKCSFRPLYVALWCPSCFIHHIMLFYFLILRRLTFRDSRRHENHSSSISLIRCLWRHVFWSIIDASLVTIRTSIHWILGRPRGIFFFILSTYVFFILTVRSPYTSKPF